METRTTSGAGRRAIVAALGLIGLVAWSRWPPADTAACRRKEVETDLLRAEVEARRFKTTRSRVLLYWFCIFGTVAIILTGIAVAFSLAGSHRVTDHLAIPVGVQAWLASVLRTVLASF